MRWSAPALVAAFVAADVLIVAGAYVLTHRDPGVVAAAAPSGTSSSAGPSTASPGADATPDWTGPLSLVAAPSGRLARVTRGSCDSRQPVRARAWVAPAYLAPLREVTVPGLQESLGVGIDDDRLRIVGAGPGCGVRGFVSDDDGRSWRRGSVPDDLWYLDADTTATTVHGPVPGGVRQVPCTPISVTTTSDGDALLSCSTGPVYRITAGAGSGANTTVAYPVQGPVGVAEGARARPLALAALDTCGAALVALSEDGSLQQRACLGKDAAPLGLASSRATTADAEPKIFVQVGYRLSYSTDGGRRFVAYPGAGDQ